MRFFSNTTLENQVCRPKSGINLYPGGMTMPGRQWTSANYRYGHNGQEKDNEIFEGAYGAEYWEYDSRTLRRWNEDPVKIHWISPYACFANNPILFADPDGDIVHVHGSRKFKKAFWKRYDADAAFRAVIDFQETAMLTVKRTGKGKTEDEVKGAKGGKDNTYKKKAHFHYRQSSSHTPETDALPMAEGLSKEFNDEQKEIDDGKGTGSKNYFPASVTFDEVITYGNGFFNVIHRESEGKYTSVDITVEGGSNTDTGKDIIIFYSGKTELGRWEIPETSYSEGLKNMFKLPSKTFHFDLPNPSKIRFEIQGGFMLNKNKGTYDKKKHPGGGGGKVTIKKGGNPRY